MCGILLFGTCVIPRPGNCGLCWPGVRSIAFTSIFGPPSLAHVFLSPTVIPLSNVIPLRRLVKNLVLSRPPCIP